jgi:hypothetical protein
MFEGVKPFDWLMLVIELLVLLAILYEIIKGELREKRERRRQGILDEKGRSLSRLLDKGLRIKATVIDPAITNPQLHGTWISSASAWIEETRSYLATFPRASAAFLETSNAGSVDNVASASGRHFVVTGEVGKSYQTLILHLENLHRISERPEAYFWAASGPA